MTLKGMILFSIALNSFQQIIFFLIFPEICFATIADKKISLKIIIFL